MGVKSFFHVKIGVRNVDRSLEFYCRKLKLREICRYSIQNGLIIQLSPTGKSPGIELWYEDSATVASNDQIHIAFYVDDLENFVAELRKEGVQIYREPFKIGHEIIAFIRDPDGYLIELNEIDESN